ncbi:MAG: L,D-transpeptidase [bacterium]
MKNIKTILLFTFLTIVLIVVTILGTFIWFFISENNKATSSINSIESAISLIKDVDSNKYSEIKVAMSEAKNKINNIKYIFELKSINSELSNYKKDIEINNKNYYKENTLQTLNKIEQNLSLPEATELPSYEEIKSQYTSLKQALNNPSIPIPNINTFTVYELDVKLAVELSFSKEINLYNELLTNETEANRLAKYFSTVPTKENIATSLTDYKSKVSDLLTKWKGKTIAYSDVKTVYTPNLSAQLSSAQELEKQIEQQKKDNQAKNVQAPTAKNNAPKFIYISIADQKMYAYEYGVPVFTTVVTTGKDLSPTVTGKFAIFQKKEQEHLRGVDTSGHNYDVLVNYWMPFYQDYGIHDTPTPTNYGGMDYHTRGSLGCIRTPLTNVKWLYNWAEIDTPVWVD